jgi:hypothetical protein
VAAGADKPHDGTVYLHSLLLRKKEITEVMT